LGHLPHQEALAHQLAADLLLLVVGSGPGSSAVATGKIYEYLAAGKPILALTPASAAADLLEEAQVGMIAPPDDPKAIASALTRLYRDWREGRLQAAPDPSFLARYDRRNQTARLAQIFDELSQPSGQTRGKIA
jgi:glycosyltransferase involved in cell wall biosynthesis